MLKIDIIYFIYVRDRYDRDMLDRYVRYVRDRYDRDIYVKDRQYIYFIHI